MSLVSNIYNGINTQPINYMAASMLFKSNEWNYVNKKLRKFIEKITSTNSIISIDYFKTPPHKNGGKENQIKDKTGIVFLHYEEKFIVTGYAHIVEKKRKKREKRRINKYLGQTHVKQVEADHSHAWWCRSLSDHKYRIFKGETINKKAKLGRIYDT